jgi:hypothetical protein
MTLQEARGSGILAFSHHSLRCDLLAQIFLVLFRRLQKGAVLRSLHKHGGGHMADIQRISAQQAHTKTKANQALLVCAYEDEAKCRMLNLDGSISFTSLQSRAASLSKTQEIIFY